MAWTSSRLVFGAGALAICGYLAVPTQALADEPTPAAAFNDVIVSDDADASIELVDGADHFFAGHEDYVARLTAEFFGRWLGRPP